MDMLYKVLPIPLMAMLKVIMVFQMPGSLKRTNLENLSGNKLGEVPAMMALPTELLPPREDSSQQDQPPQRMGMSQVTMGLWTAG